MFRVYIIAILLLGLSVGCEPYTYHLPDASVPTDTAVTQFDPRNAGSISGRIRWQGAIPNVPMFEIPGFTLTRVKSGTIPNPNAPKIDESTGAISSAVVFLRGIDPVQARPWDLPSVGVELSDATIEVRQGEFPLSHVGFVRAGAAVRFESHAVAIAGVRGRGADNFCFVFPPKAMPVVRNLKHEGRIELLTASGQFWAAADLIVLTHPYVSRVDAQGQFSLQDVPNGNHELVVWHANWHAKSYDRDTETGAFARQGYHKPIEKIVPVAVHAGKICNIDVTLSANDFLPR